MHSGYMLIIEILRFSGLRYFYDFHGIPFPIFSFSLSVSLSFSTYVHFIKYSFFPAFAATLRKYSWRFYSYSQWIPVPRGKT